MHTLACSVLSANFLSCTLFIRYRTLARSTFRITVISRVCREVIDGWNTSITPQLWIHICIYVVIISCIYYYTYHHLSRQHRHPHYGHNCWCPSPCDCNLSHLTQCQRRQLRLAIYFQTLVQKRLYFWLLWRQQNQDFDKPHARH